MQRIGTDLNNDLSRVSCRVERVSVCDVRAAVSRLKARESDGCTSMTTDHIINAGDDCLMHISPLLNAIIIHHAWRCA